MQRAEEGEVVAEIHPRLGSAEFEEVACVDFCRVSSRIEHINGGEHCSFVYMFVLLFVVRVICSYARNDHRWYLHRNEMNARLILVLSKPAGLWKAALRTGKEFCIISRTTQSCAVPQLLSSIDLHSSRKNVYMFTIILGSVRGCETQASQYRRRVLRHLLYQAAANWINVEQPESYKCPTYYTNFSFQTPGYPVKLVRSYNISINLQI